MKAKKILTHKIEDFLYLHNIKIRLKKNKSCCISELQEWTLKNRNNNPKCVIGKGKTLMDAFIDMGVKMSKNKLYPPNTKDKPIKVPKLF
jgi:hypothetical protein